MSFTVALEKGYKQSNWSAVGDAIRVRNEGFGQGDRPDGSPCDTERPRQFACRALVIYMFQSIQLDSGVAATPSSTIKTAGL